MAITFVDEASAGEGQTSTTSSLSITIPSTAAVDDVAIITVDFGSSSTTLTTPTGWTVLSGPDTDSSLFSCWTLAKALESGEPGSSVDLNFGAAGRCVAHMRVYSGADTTVSNYLVDVLVDTVATTTITLPTLANVPADALVDAAFARRRGGTVAALNFPAPYTAHTQVSTNYGTGANAFSRAAYDIAETTGTYGGESDSTAGQSNLGANYLVAIPIASGGASLTETPADDEDLTDSALVTYGRLPADDEDLTDAATTAHDAVRPSDDDLGLTDSVEVTTGPNPADALGLADSVATVGTFERTQDDDLGLTDSVVAIVGQFAEDDLGLTDSVTLVRTTFIEVDDALGLTEVCARTFGIPLADDLGLTDQATPLTGPRDNLGLTDSVTTVGTFVLSVGDSLGLLDVMGEVAPGYLPGTVGLASDGLSTAVLADEAMATAELLDQHGAVVLADAAGTAVIET
jgi:hypothetical protein